MGHVLLRHPLPKIIKPALLKHTHSSQTNFPQLTDYHKVFVSVPLFN